MAKLPISPSKTETIPETDPAPEVRTPASGGSYVLDEATGIHTLTEQTQAQATIYRCIPEKE